MDGDDRRFAVPALDSDQPSTFQFGQASPLRGPADAVHLEHAVSKREGPALVAPVEVAEMQGQRVDLGGGAVEAFQPTERHPDEMLAPFQDLLRRDRAHLVG